MPVTVRDVALRAGVDVGTVSRALRGQRHVSAECMQRVAAAVKALGYRPLRRRAPIAANALTGRTVGVVLLGMHHSLAALPAVRQVITAVEASLITVGAEVAHLDVPDLNAVPALLARGRLDALILKSAMQGEVLGGRGPALAHLRKLPSVWVTGRPHGAWGDAATADDHAAGAMAARHLLAGGHTRLAVINPKPDHLLFMRREDGFLAAARRAGATVALHAPTLLVARRRWRLPLRPIEFGDEIDALVTAALAASKPPTALFVPADGVAVAVHRALVRRRLRPGTDIALVSCNHEPELIAGLDPPLTTVDIRLSEIGRLAVELLAWRLSAGAARPPVELTVEPELVHGGTA